MNEEQPGVDTLESSHVGYGTLAQDGSSCNPTANILLDENEASSFDRQSSFEEARTPFIVPDRENMSESPDHILNSYGSSNPYILMIFLLMSFVWTLCALPMMVSAFLLGGVCRANATNCTPTEGTISEEFNLTGERAKFSDLTTVAFLLGNAIGASPISYVSDTRGRRAGLILSLAFLGIFGLLSALSKNVYMFMALRLCQGLMFPGCGVINWIHAYESTPASLRRYSALVFGLMWVLGYCSLAPIAYLLLNWRHLMIASSLPNLLYAILLYFILPDSFHFLVTREKKDGLNRWLMNANRVSRNPRIDLTADVIIDAHRRTQQRNSANMTTKSVLSELVKKKVLFVYILVLGYLWTCDSFVYYGISLISTLLSGAGSKYWSYFFTGIVEIPSYLLSPFLLDLIGRRLFVSISHLLTAAAFMGIICVEDEKLSFVLWLIGKFGISCAFTALFVYASEIFPTIIRSSCIGFCVILARVGGIFAPFTRLMTIVNPNLPNIFFAVSAALGGLLTLILPETKNHELPDSISEVVTEEE